MLQEGASPPNDDFTPILADRFGCSKMKHLGCFKVAPAPPNNDFSRIRAGASTSQQRPHPNFVASKSQNSDQKCSHSWTLFFGRLPEARAHETSMTVFSFSPPITNTINRASTRFSLTRSQLHKAPRTRFFNRPNFSPTEQKSTETRNCPTDRKDDQETK